MAGGSDSSTADERVIPSESILGDLGYALAFAIAAIVLYFSGLYFIAFTFWKGGGEANAFDYGSLTPPSTELSTLAPYLFAYVGWLFGVLFASTSVYCAVVRPLQRIVGQLGGDDGDVAGRSSLSVATTDGTRTVAPDAECADCEERAIGVIATTFEGDEPSDVAPVCPSHLHEHRNERESDGLPVDVWTFAAAGDRE